MARVIDQPLPGCAYATSLCPLPNERVGCRSGCCRRPLLRVQQGGGGGARSRLIYVHTPWAVCGVVGAEPVACLVRAHAAHPCSCGASSGLAARRGVGRTTPWGRLVCAWRRLVYAPSNASSTGAPGSSGGACCV